MIHNTTKEPRFEWLFGGNPAAIEAQEAQGQKELVASSQLPAKVNHPYGTTAAEQYAALGIRIIGQSKGDNMFLDVELPSGWTIEPTSHPMWSHLVDNNGKKVASIFYKAAFYDREAFINIESE